MMRIFLNQAGNAQNITPQAAMILKGKPVTEPNILMTFVRTAPSGLLCAITLRTESSP